MDRKRLDPGGPPPGRGVLDLGGHRSHRISESIRCLTGRRSQSDKGTVGSGGFGENRHEHTDGMGLAGAGSSRDDREVTLERNDGRRMLQILRPVLAWSQPGRQEVECLASDELLRQPDAAHDAARKSCLVLVVALEIQPILDEDQRRLGIGITNERAGGDRRRPLVRIGPGQFVDDLRIAAFDDHRGPLGPEPDTDVPVASAADGEGGCQQHPGIVLVVEPTDRGRGKDVERREHPGIVERRYEAVGVDDHIRIRGGAGGALGDRHGSSPANRALRSTMSSGGGAQRYTPPRSPSTTAVLEPRTNRYADPPRWAAGS